MAPVTATDHVRVRELVPTIATIARSVGWEVVDLHGNKANPAGTSLPDLMLTREGRPPLMVKALTPRGELSAPQQKWFKHYQACGFQCMAFHSDQIAEVFEVLSA